MTAGNPPIAGGRPGTESPPPQQLFRGTAALVAAALIQRSLGLLLLPLFTRVLSPAEYGQIGVIASVTAAIPTVLGFGLDTALLRGYVRSGGDGTASRVLINTVGGFAIVLPLSVCGLGIVLLAPSATFMGVSTEAMALALAGAAATTAATAMPLALFRAQGRFADYFRLTATQVVLTTGMAVFFVAVLRWGVTGWVLAGAAGSFLVLALGLGMLRHRWTWEFDPRALAQALAFGLPLVPHALAHWGLSVSDRTLLGAFVSDVEIGHYYVAYQACVPVTVLAIAISRATQPTFAAAAESSVSRGQLARTSTFQVLLVSLTAASVALLGPPLIRLVLPPSYAPAADFLPWLSIGSALFGLYLIPMNSIAVMTGRTGRVWIITALAASLNVGLNLVLIPRIGAQGAAINTAVGYLALLTGVTMYMRRVSDPPIPFEYLRLTIGTSLILAVGLVATLFTPPEPAMALAVRLAAIAAVIVVLVRALFYREASNIYQMVRSRAGGIIR